MSLSILPEAQLLCSRRVFEWWDEEDKLFLRIKHKSGGQLSSSIRILTADDFRGWRLQYRLLLQGRPEWQIIAEASDGSQAVQKAAELQPDLILLDTGLPKLNGIEAALRIRQLSPISKIIFLSLQNSLVVVQAALSTGAMGYVRKTDSLRELLPAMDTVLRGKPFVSSSLRGFEFTDRLFRRSDVVFSE